MGRSKLSEWERVEMLERRMDGRWSRPAGKHEGMVLKVRERFFFSHLRTIWFNLSTRHPQCHMVSQLTNQTNRSYT